MPRHLALEVTRHCNYHCPWCYCVWHEFPELATRDLPRREWLKIIDRAVDSGTDDLLFTGGEALLRRDIFDLIGYARRRLPDGELSLFTNGSRLTDAMLKRFRNLRVHLATSLPGLKTYGVMTGTRRTCFPTLALLARAKELRWPMQVSLTATKVNASEFVDMFCAAAFSGAVAVQMGAVMLEGRARNRTDLALSRPEWEELKSAIRALPDSRIGYNFCDEMICACRDDQPTEYLKNYGLPDAPRCPAGRDFGVIGPEGGFRDCLHAVK
ncbi:MAG: radical SAM protein [Victivallaceae bacterium]|nr:radical SAM protein [Victivallaceae bacterium]